MGHGLTWWHQLCNGWGGSNYATINIKKEAKRRLSSQWDVAAQWLNWRCQLRNFWGGSNDDNGNGNKDNDAEMTTTKQQQQGQSI